VRVLVVGGAGYLGDATLDALQVAGHEVWVYDALLYCDLYQRDVRFTRGGVSEGDRVLLDPCLLWADAVVWLAALVGDAACEAQPDVAQEVNAESVGGLVDRFKGRIVFPSTCSVYGRRDEALTEDADLAPLSVYGQTKVEAERRLVGADAVVFRLGTLFGCGGRFGRFRMDLAVNGMTVRAAIDRRVTVYGGEQWRPFLHVRDAAEAIVVGLTGKPGTYNLVGDNMRLRELAALLSVEVAGLRVDWKDSAENADPRTYRVIAEKATRDLGFQASMTVRSGIREILELVTSGRMVNPDSPRFHNRATQLLTWGR